MPIFILIIAFYGGDLPHKDSASLAAIEFTSKSKCEAAGLALTKSFENPTKTTHFVCVEK